MPYEWIGRKLGGYRVIERIGAGSMAEVYKALQTSVNRMVAIKVLSSAFTEDVQFVERFRQEAQIIATLEHPHIVPVIDFGEQEGTLYLVMRYLKGGTLHDLIQKGPLPPATALRYLAQMGEALDYAHGLNIIHRDIKPKNVLLDLQANASIGDYGLSKILTGGGLTRSGLGMIGTPHYMSPEQGRGLAVDGRSDLYSLAIVLFEMLTGRVPFDADSAVGIVMKHISEPVPSVTAINPKLPPELDEVFKRALAKDPAARYPTAQAIVEDVANVLQAPVPITGTLPVVSGKPAETAAEGGATGGVKITPPPKPTLRQELRLGWRNFTERILLVRALLQRFIRERGSLLLALGGIILAAALVYLLYTWLPRRPVLIPTTTPTPPQPTATLPPTASPSPAPSTAQATPTASLPPATPSPSPIPTQVLPARYEWEKDGMTLVLIPAGEFLLGAADTDKQALEDEKPQQTIYVDAFWIDRTEVTVAQFQDFVNATGYTTDAERGCCDGKYARPGGNVYAPDMVFVKSATWLMPEGAGVSAAQPRNPVVQVSWNDAKAYCEWAGRRLPTEAEWEKAARGESGLIYPWGNDFDGRNLNFCDKSCTATWRNLEYDDSFARRSNVGIFSTGASPYDVLDMAGNVREWVNDFYDFRGYYRIPTANPGGLETGKTHSIRGGSWLDSAVRVRATAREDEPPDARDNLTGFRCAVSSIP